MEETPTPAPTSAPPTGPTSQVMDVVPPPAAPEQSALAEGMATPPPPQPDDSAPPEAAAAPAKSKPAEAKAPKPPAKPRAKGVTAAIIATVVIVLGLAALAVYAYTKTK